MTVKTIRQALHEALEQEMRRDPRVVVIGEDVSGGAGTEGGRDAAGGGLGGTKGCGSGRGCDRAAAGRGTYVLGFPGGLLRSDLQPGCKVPLHVRRQGTHAAG